MAQAFYIRQSGNWPNETYTIALCGNIINPNNGPFPAFNFLRFQENPTNETTSISNAFDNLGTFTYKNSNPFFTDGGLFRISTTQNTNFVWSISSERAVANNDIGYTINSFYIDSTPKSGTSNVSGVPLQNKLYYSYLLIPSRFILAPYPNIGSAITWDGTTFNTRVIPGTTPLTAFYYSTTGAPTLPAVNDLYNYIQGNYTPSVSALLFPLNHTTLTYNICAVRTRVEVPLLTFSKTRNPYYFSTILENTPLNAAPFCYIRPYSTFLSFLHSYYFNDGLKNNLITFGQQKPDTIVTSQRKFESSYILTQDLAGKTQTFQMIQLKADNSLNFLSSPQYCILSSVLVLSTANIKYYNNFYSAPDLSVIVAASGVPNSILGFTYIADCPTFTISNQTVGSAFYGATNISKSNVVPLNSPISTSNANDVNFSTQYPPHYYNFKATVIDSSTSAQESTNLTFKLNSSIQEKTYTETGAITSIKLRNYLGSDFNLMTYDYSLASQGLAYNGLYDKIIFNAITNAPTILDSLSCYYGPNLDVPYSLANPTWIPAESAVNLLISYPIITHGELNFMLRPSLSSSVAGQMDGWYALPVNLAQGYLPYNPGTNIFIIKTREVADFIEVDSSFLNSVSSWPTKDLTSSYVSWSISPTSKYVNIYSVDLSGNFIQPISQNTPYLWNSRTWSVAVTGYGPQTTTITLSSQKYNQTTNLSTVSSLFDYFVENRILVTPVVDLNNYNYIRTITLKASVPYQGRTYDLPNNNLLNWTWAYNFDNSYTMIPISAYDVSSNYYNFGATTISQNISSIQILVVPQYSTSSPRTNTVSVAANVDTPRGQIAGSYNFEVDDFPAPNIFNTDFYASYTQFPSKKDNILETRNNVFAITRPNLSFNDYTFTPYSDVITSFYRTYSGSFIWYLKTTESPVLTSNTGGFSFRYNILNPSNSILSLCAINATPPGWTSAHNVQTSVNIYIINYLDFFKPLSFIAYPQYYWENGKLLTVTTPINYTYSLAPTAYANKKSNSQGFWLSANKSVFTDFEYLIGSNNSTITPVTSSLALVEIPYTSELLSASGVPISLSAFNTTSYPKYNGISFIAPINGNLVSLPFNNTASTVSYTNTLTGSQTNFNRPPNLVPYGQVTFSYTPVLTSLLVDQQPIVSVVQTISTYPLDAPAQPVGGTIVYTLSTGYWSVSQSVPAVNGTFNLFNLNIGDAAIPLTVNGLYTTTLTLGASANILSQIPPSTFNNYPSLTATGNLWNQVQNIIIADNKTITTNLTSIIPQIYFSQLYALTGQNISIQYETPYILNNNIVAYITNFGENSPEATRVSAFDETLNYQYKNSGTYYISYSAIFDNNLISAFQSNVPLVIENNWSVFNPNTLRKVEDATLILPYNQNEILIQPNEFGDADIFNTCITRIQSCIDYLGNNLKTFNNASPTVYFGWLGTNNQDFAGGIKWHTQSFYPTYYLLPSFAVSGGSSYFSDIRDVKETQDHIFVLDGKNIRTFLAGKIPTEIFLNGEKALQNILINPTSIEYDDAQSILFVADPPNNRIFRFDLNLYQTIPDINPALNVGGLGNRFDTGKFNSPSEIVYANKNLYVLDFNNYCVKEFNSDLSWRFTYFTDEFGMDNPINIAVHPIFNYLYVLTESNTVYVFDEKNTNIVSTFNLNQGFIVTNIRKIIFDENGDFVYVITSSKVHKYSSDGYYVTTLNLPTDSTFVTGKQSSNRSLLFCGSNYISKVQDVLELYSMGSGLPTQYWSMDQLMVSRDEFSLDLNYNRSLVRLAQNLKTFRSSLNARLVLATEQTSTNIITYFAIAPLLTSDLPVFDNNIELENIGVGVNELHVPQTLNKELVKFYEGVSYLTSLLNIKNYNVNATSDGCNSQFCWSWKSMSCYNLTLPAVRICSINPITYAELEENFPVSYAPTKIWGQATSICCSNVVPPV